MAIAIALLEFNDLRSSVTPTFLFRDKFYLQLSPHCPKMNKKSTWEVKKFSRFLSSGHGIRGHGIPGGGGGGGGRTNMFYECMSNDA